MRKRKAGRWVLGLGAMLLTVLAANAFWFEPESLTVDRFDVQTPYWPQSTAPIRAVFLTDLHIDPLHMTPARVRKIVQQVNALHPDIVLLGGDYVGTDWLTVHRMRQLWARSKADTARENEGFQALSGLSAPLGVYGVLGNHDCWWSCDEAARQLNEAGVHVLTNQSARVKRPGGDLWLAGLANKTTDHPDFAKALNGVPKGAALITLIHEPDPFADHPETKLMLAGHTHAGQVRFPWIGAPIRNSRYLEETAKGWLTRGDRILIVSRGLGESGVPVRFGAPPQIMVLNIHAGKAAAVSMLGRS